MLRRSGASRFVRSPSQAAGPPDLLGHSDAARSAWRYRKRRIHAKIAEIAARPSPQSRILIPAVGVDTPCSGCRRSPRRRGSAREGMLNSSPRSTGHASIFLAIRRVLVARRNQVGLGSPCLLLSSGGIQLRAFGDVVIELSRSASQRDHGPSLSG